MIVVAACGGRSSVPRLSLPTTATVLSAPTPLPPDPSSVPPTARNYSVYFLNAAHGWLGRGASQEGQLLVTLDGGASWAQQYHGEVTPQVTDFVDDENGWIAGCVIATGISGRCKTPLLATHDGGKTWTRVTSYAGGQIVGIRFLSSRDGWVLADSCQAPCGVAPAQLFRTDDGGVTWSELHLPDGANGPLSVQRLNANTAWVVTQGSIVITRDGGANWTAVANPCHLPQPNLGSDFYGGPLDFVDATHGWLGCTSRNGGGGMAAKTLYQTLDGGFTWQLVGATQTASNKNPPGVGELSEGGTATDIHFFNATTGWLDLDGPQSFLYHTDDGGRTWSAVDDGVGGGIAHLFFTDPTHGWAWGSVALLRTTDGGAHWQRSEVPP
jgi:photosystem II stability/assembly factor-like uncharacterized protein